MRENAVKLMIGYYFSNRITTPKNSSNRHNPQVRQLNIKKIYNACIAELGREMA